MTKESPELILSMIACLLAEGLDCRDAVIEVGETRVTAAMLASKDRDTSGRLLAVLSVKTRMDTDDDEMIHALELSANGWIAEDPRKINSPNLPPPKTVWEKTPVGSWYWRRPSKRKGKPGRRYLSTNQALNALRKERGEA